MISISPRYSHHILCNYLLIVSQIDLVVEGLAR